MWGGWLRGLRPWGVILGLGLGLFATSLAWGQGTRQTTTYRRLKAALDAIPAIDTHDHLWPFERLSGYMETPHGRGMNLAGLWRNSYFPGVHRLTPWTPGTTFEAWWDRAKPDFDDARATSFYRYQLPAFLDLYGVDFDRITDAQARDLDQRIFANYRNADWLYQVITERANIELMLNDPYWGRLEFKTDYPFGVLVFNVTTLGTGFHPSEFKQASDDPYGFQGLGEEGLKLLREVADRHQMLTHSTIFDAAHMPLFARYVDIVQVSERDMRNYALLKELAKLGKPVILRRGASSTIEETLMAADFVMRCGDHQVIVCERGIRTFETYTRHTLDLSAIPVIKKLSCLPIIVDPSRAMGRRDKVPPMARAAVAAGADGLLIEVHHDPDHALTDGAQSLTLEQFDKLTDQLRVIASAVERTL